MAGAADLKEDVALMFELDFFVVELARQEHAAIGPQQLSLSTTRRVRPLVVREEAARPGAVTAMTARL